MAHGDVKNENVTSLSCHSEKFVRVRRRLQIRPMPCEFSDDSLNSVNKM